MPRIKVFALLMLALSCPAFAVQTTNLLTNPGAETGDLTGWTAACAPSGCTPPTVDSGTLHTGINPHSGSYDFVGSPNNPDGTLTQTVTIVGVQGITTAEINSGELSAQVSFWEQSLNQVQNGQGGEITLTFLSASNTVLGTATTAAVNSEFTSDGLMSKGWLFDNPCARCIESFKIPPNTVSISYTMNFLSDGSPNDIAFIDDNSLSVSSSATPATGADSVALGLQTAHLGEGRASYTVWDPSTGRWSVTLPVATGGFETHLVRLWGESSDLPVIGDFDGDGRSDIAAYRPSNGYWYIIQSSTGLVVSTQWGESSDIPVTGDFDGDGKTDIAVYRPSTGYWYIIQSSNGAIVARQWGEPTDIPVVGDFDGDGKSDIAVFRPSNGYWYIIQSSTGSIVAQQWGAPTDIPVAGDFDGDGKSDIAVYRPSNGVWYVVQSSNGAVVTTQFGQSGDIPVARDYDGDGITDIAFYVGGTTYVIQSSTGAFSSEPDPDEDENNDVPVNSLSR